VGFSSFTRYAFWVVEEVLKILVFIGLYPPRSQAVTGLWRGVLI
jgi:hypothetical protein